MDHLDERHQLLAWIGPRTQVGDRPLLDPSGRVRIPGRYARQSPGTVVGHVVTGRHVHAVDPRQRPQQVGAPGSPVRRAVPGAAEIDQHIVDLSHDLLAVTEDEAVDEVGQRLGVEGAVPTGHHQRMIVGTVGAPDRHPGQVDEVEDVRVDELGRQIEGDDVEIRRRMLGFDGEQGHSGRPHRRLHVDPGGVGPLGGRVGAFVQDLVEDLQALVRQADLVRVRVHEQPGHHAGSMLHLLGAQLTADVASRLRDLGEERLDLWPEGLHLPLHPRGRALMSWTGGRADALSPAWSSWSSWSTQARWRVAGSESWPAPQPCSVGPRPR